MSALKENKICIASVSGAHGVRGDLKIRVYLDYAGDIADYSPLFLENGDVFPLRKVLRSLPSSVVASVEGVTDRDQALKLRGERIYVLRDQLPETESNTYYHTDLIGLAVCTEDGADVGKIKYVHDYGAGPLLEVFEPATHKSVLVPFRDEAVPTVELGSHVVINKIYLEDLYEA